MVLVYVWDLLVIKINFDLNSGLICRFCSCILLLSVLIVKFSCLLCRVGRNEESWVLYMDICVFGKIFLNLWIILDMKVKLISEGKLNEMLIMVLYVILFILLIMFFILWVIDLDQESSICFVLVNVMLVFLCIISLMLK